ncbi:Holliday junction DNA helicase subunit RuvA [Verrucomicrobium sp. GAS474]|uniref:Holliday junction branch migration protein RuvA n=1 Tax=Verrucomicrobium sp. GAS474 TaxID=1882831 RepID=UPI000879E4CB|nr:Holliday junction branch migration protein RuvA [Verrucomicrobium sp. GAS474]SDT93921.1 Holliday junction DNA helicase subunit RuvA [Verrucomicrobium sp. GAS474]
MIAYLNGTLVASLPTQAVVEVGGVGYEVLIPLGTFERLPAPPAPVRLLTHLQVREDAHVLYGFATDEERDLFRLLITHVSGIGPKSALAILSGTSPAQFRAAVVANDLAVLGKIKGVGKKTAERVVVELRDKVGVSAAWEAASARHTQSPAEQQLNDAVLALVALGYTQAAAAKALTAVRTKFPGADTETLIRETLRAF